MSNGHHPRGHRASFRPSAKCGRGFTLIELLIVIAIIGILSALIITTVSNAAQDARTVVARQQQITLQDALNAEGEQARHVFRDDVARPRFVNDSFVLMPESAPGR